MTLVEKVARAIYALHPAVRFDRGPKGQAPLNRAATWDEATADEREDDIQAARAAIEAYEAALSERTP